MSQLFSSLVDSWWMLYETFWALVLGFTLSGVIQAFGSRVLISGKMGRHNPTTIVRAGFLGAVSSSCSYAASSIAKALFDKGADFTSSMVFMFASTNLVFDLGLAIWALLGWKFAVAELLGGVIMIVLLSIALPFALRNTPVDRDQLERRSSSTPISSKPTLLDAAGFTVGDLTMLRGELIAGFLVAGVFDTLIPERFWHSLFLSGGGVVATLENVIVAPLIAAGSFVCSVGNIPLAAALWHKGISFGGTLTFIFADLLTIPLILIYRKYFGTAVTVRLVLTFWFVMSLSGLVTQSLVDLVALTPTRVSSVAPQTHVANTATTWLNFVAVIILVAVGIGYRVRQRQGPSDLFAKDPICGMQVTINTASEIYERGGETYYFCSPGCREVFAHQ